MDKVVKTELNIFLINDVCKIVLEYYTETCVNCHTFILYPEIPYCDGYCSELCWISDKKGYHEYYDYCRHYSINRIIYGDIFN